MSLSHEEITRMSRELQRLDEDERSYWARYDLAVEQGNLTRMTRALNGVYSSVERRLQIMDQFE